jgi:hypothetical protein
MESVMKSDDNSIMRKPFSMPELLKCVSSLKNKKAPGWDNVSAEHIKYGGKDLLCAIRQLFIHMVNTEIVPPDLKKGVIIPIPKGEKDETIMSNNRGITLLPVIGKLYEKILLNRHLDNCGTRETIDQLQGASQSYCSSLHTTWLLREVISHNIEQDSTVYIALLDLSKAFDSVWVKGMFLKLLKSGMDPVLWRIMRNFYNNFKCCVRIGGKFSMWFKTGQGVHHGPLGLCTCS